MKTPAIHITGMPYVPGTARGRLQRGMQDNPVGKIVLLKQPLTDPFGPLPAAFVMVDGAPFSHSLIPLLGSGVPVIMITRSEARLLQPGMELVLDGAAGLLTTDLSRDVSRHEPSVAVSTTRDGMAVSLRVSARGQRAVQHAVESGAGAIGLLRSEFLVPDDGTPPDAAFYRSAFRTLCETAAGLPLTIRLFDVAASKRPSWLSLAPADAGVLGRQGVRLYADEPVHGIYRAQLQAIATLVPEFDVRILLPYVADLAELQYWHDDIRRQLVVPAAVGAMAETPAAALQLREWLEVVEFVAIGCNDLMQCLFGADRDQPELQRYLDPYAPVLYRFLRQVAAAVQDRLDAVQLCGVLPQLPGILPLLLGLGFRVFSVEATLLPYLWQTIARTDAAEAHGFAEQVCQARGSAAVRELLLRHAGPLQA